MSSLRRKKEASVTMKGEVVEEISNYYSKLFTTEDSYNWEDKLNGIPSTITNSMNLELIKPVEDVKVQRALFFYESS